MTTPYTPGGTQPRPRKRRLRDWPYIGPVLDYALSPWSLLSDIRARLMAHGIRLNQMEDRMTAFEEALADLDTVTDEMADRIEAYEAVNAELRDAVANGETERAQALATQAGAHTGAIVALTEKLRGAGKDPEAPVDTTPLPESPAPVDPGTGAGDTVEQ